MHKHIHTGMHMHTHAHIHTALPAKALFLDLMLHLGRMLVDPTSSASGQQLDASLPRIWPHLDHTQTASRLRVHNTLTTSVLPRLPCHICWLQLCVRRLKLKPTRHRDGGWRLTKH